MRKTGYILVLLLFVASGCATLKNPSEEAKRTEITNYLMTEQEQDLANSQELGAFRENEYTLVLSIPDNAVLLDLWLEGDVLILSLAYEEKDWVSSAKRITIEAPEPIPEFIQVRFHLLEGDVIDTILPLERLLEMAEGLLGAELTGVYMIPQIAMMENTYGLSYYIDFTYDERRSWDGSRVFSGWLELDAKTGEAIGKSIQKIFLPYVRKTAASDPDRLRKVSDPHFELTGWGNTLELIVDDAAEFGAVILSLRALHADGRVKDVWVNEQLALDEVEGESIGQIAWSPDGTKTYFSTMMHGNHFSGRFTLARLWEYDWVNERLSLLSFMPDVDFTLAFSGDKIYFEDLILDLSARHEDMSLSKQIQEPSFLVALYSQPDPYMPRIEKGFNPEKPYEIFKEAGKWIYLQQGEARGWLPVCFTADSVVRMESPIAKIMVEGATVTLCPKEDGIIVMDSVTKGKVFFALAMQGDWVYGKAISSDGVGIHYGWVLSRFLREYDPLRSIEGVIPAGARVYPVWGFDEKNEYSAETLAAHTYVTIDHCRNGWCKVTGSDGWFAWVSEEDYYPNPWFFE